jgi:VPS62-like protein
MSDAARQRALLDRHQPYLRYDSHEQYFADAAEMFTDGPGMRLRAAGSAKDIATAGHGLSLAFLGHDNAYPGTDIAPAPGDTLGIPDRRYRERAAALHEQPAIRNVVYGHVATDRDGATWLQYWYCYLFNDYNLIGFIVKAGLHEGDWELVQLRLGGDGAPDHAVYAQHAHAAGRPWDQVERVPGTQRPVVYVARGSHASYFEPGTKWTGVWFDYADGKRQSPERQRLVHVVDGDHDFHWVRWAGHWGDTPRGGGVAPADSPRSPGTRKHWRDPQALLEVAVAKALEALPARPAPPAAPTVAIERTTAGAKLTWSVVAAADGTLPTVLTVTVNSKDLPAPPMTTNFAIDGPSGALDLEGLDPTKRYDIFVSDATAAGLASESVRRDLPILV